ncbi:MAG: alginate export family protein [Aureispira sp.]|nr:alginate export family protein [Aureispira sp.]
MKKLFLLVLSTVFVTSAMFAQQFDLSAEIRPRYENKNGFKSLRAKDQKSGNFISQRTRLNFDYKHGSRMAFKVALQNVFVWGDAATMSVNSQVTSLQQAWAEVFLIDKLSLKLGRQEIVYDDHRIFGNVGWAQQARSHDAFLIKYKPSDKHRLDVGFAYSADNQGGVDALYSNAAGYKTFQYAWYHGDFDKIGLSFLALNTGIQYLKDAGLSTETKKTTFMQTFGPRLTMKFDKFSADVSGYVQTGKALESDVFAYNAALNARYQVIDMLTIGLGAEMLSGKSMDDTDTKVKSFAPLFGTNHKFNGWMDYFYVGNHGNSVGLTDVYATFVLKKGKFLAKLIPHAFLSGANIFRGTEKMGSYLGAEVDFMLKYKINPSVAVSGGYSQMIASESMEVLKGGDRNAFNSWAWVMFTFKPKLISYKFPEKK